MAGPIVCVSLLGCLVAVWAAEQAESEVCTGEVCEAKAHFEEDSSMVQLRGLNGPGDHQREEGHASYAQNSQPYFYPKGAADASAEDSKLIINEDGVNKTYYLPGAPTLDGGLTVKYEPPYRYYIMRTAIDDYSKEENFYQVNFVGKTFSVDIDFGADGPACGCNLNFYLVDMPWSTPGSSRDYYCDAQCFSDHGCCSEFDINEGNMHVQQVTNHACQGWSCSKGGDPWDKTHPGQFGKGARHRIDSTKPFTYSTRFEKAGGNLKIVVTLSQEGREVLLRLGPGGGAMNSMMADMEKGMVFVTGYWQASNMNWMDGEVCGGGAESCNRHPAYITNWRITTNGSPAPTPAPQPPAPGPPSPPSPPAAGKCCWGGCSACNNNADGFCNQGGRDRCEGSCGGQWC